MSAFIPAQPGNTLNTVNIPLDPIGATPEWVAAVAAANGQCQHEQAPKGRCQHTQTGGYRLYLHTDDRVYCDTHMNQFRPAPAPRKARRGQDGPDLFDVLAEQAADAAAVTA